MRPVFLFVVVCCLVFAAPVGAQPNVILIVTDDQRWDTVKYMPTVQAELQGKGVTFSNAFVVNPLCCPSRASILTGTYSHTHGIWTNNPAFAFDHFQDDSTLPVWLDSVDYETMMIGKYIHGYWPPFASETYVPPGWDRWFANWTTPHLYFDYDITDGATIHSYGSDPSDYMTDVLGGEAVRFIRDSGSEPFFLYWAPKAPHITLASQSWFSTEPAPRHIDGFAGLGSWRAPNVNEPDVADKPRWIRNRGTYSHADLAELREEQLEALLAVDDVIAEMLVALEETGKLADTLIVFTSDNGWMWGEHRVVNKILPYEESIRVPMVVRYDRLGLPSRTEGRLALNVDLAATITAAAGIQVAGLEGRSLLPVLAGPTPTWRSSFLIEQGGTAWMPAYCAFRSHRWKYVQYADGTEELYDLARDPFELLNVVPYGKQRPLMMAYRTRVRASRCRPPGYAPKSLCTRSGTSRSDTIRGTRRRDWICAGRGRDIIWVKGGGRDTVRCGRGIDTVYANRRDVVHGCETVRI